MPGWCQFSEKTQIRVNVRDILISGNPKPQDQKFSGCLDVPGVCKPNGHVENVNRVKSRFRALPDGDSRRPTRSCLPLPAMRRSPKSYMVDFPVLLPEGPKPPLKWPKRSLLTVAAIVGAWTIATYLVMPWISKPDTTTTVSEDRLTIDPHEVIHSQPTSKDVAMSIEATTNVTPTPLPASPTSTITPKPIILTPAPKPRPVKVNSGRYYMFLPPFLHGVPDTSAPFYRWTQSGEFHSAVNCERFRRQAISDTVNDRDQDDTQFKSLYDDRIKILTVASCVSAHDPRMKEVQSRF